MPLQMKQIELETIDIMTEEEEVCKESKKLPFPAVHIGVNGFYFNVLASNYLEKSRVVITKTVQNIVFQSTDHWNGYFVRRYDNRPGCFVGSSHLMQLLGLPFGSVYRLFSTKDHRLAIQRYSPVTVREERCE